MGFNVVALKGAIVRKYPDGRIEVIKPADSEHTRRVNKSALNIFLRKVSKKVGRKQGF
jgi:hypothetical protein